LHTPNGELADRLANESANYTLRDDKIAEAVPQKQSKNRQKQTNKQTQGVTTAL